MDPDTTNNGGMPADDGQAPVAPVADDQNGQAPVAPVADDNGAATNEEAPAVGGDVPVGTPAEETPAEEPAA